MFIGKPMELQLETSPKGHFVHAIADDHITVGDHVYSNSIIIAPSVVIPNWPPFSAAGLTSDDIDMILDLESEIIIIGTGTTFETVDPSVLSCAVELGISIEFMSTRAACRTYNLLASEDRRIAAGIIITHCNPMSSSLASSN